MNFNFVNILFKTRWKNINYRKKQSNVSLTIRNSEQLLEIERQRGNDDDFSEHDVQSDENVHRRLDPVQLERGNDLKIYQFVVLSLHLEHFDTGYVSQLIQTKQSSTFLILATDCTENLRIHC